VRFLLLQLSSPSGGAGGDGGGDDVGFGLNSVFLMLVEEEEEEEEEEDEEDEEVAVLLVSVVLVVEVLEVAVVAVVVLVVEVLEVDVAVVVLGTEVVVLVVVVLLLEEEEEEEEEDEEEDEEEEEEKLFLPLLLPLLLLLLLGGGFENPFKRSGHVSSVASGKVSSSVPSMSQNSLSAPFRRAYISSPRLCSVSSPSPIRYTPPLSHIFSSVAFFPLSLRNPTTSGFL
jgi:hypothetical protein